MDREPPNRRIEIFFSRSRSISLSLRTAQTFIALFLIAVMTVVSLGNAGANPPHLDNDPHRFQGEYSHNQEDLDNRRGARAPAMQQRAAIAQQGVRVRWNMFGTPASLSSDTGVLASGFSGDPVAVARAWTKQNRAMFRLSEQGVDDLEVVYSVPLSQGRAVLFRQRFGDLPAGVDGLLAVGVRGDAVVYASSSIAGDADASPAATAAIAAQDAIVTAAVNAGQPVRRDQITELAAHDDTRHFRVDGFSNDVSARLVAAPTPLDGVRVAWEITLIDNAVEPLAFTTFVDAQTNSVLLREGLVDYFDPENPRWKVFPNAPSLDLSSEDTRAQWCTRNTDDAECQLLLQYAASPFAWDVDARTGEPTFTTIGNNARVFHKWNSNFSSTVGTEPATPRPDRNYSYPWTNQWAVEKCNPDTTFTSPARNDIDAARANLFAMHNLMHNWSYHLGFTEETFNLQAYNFGRGGAENDPEQGNAQAGGVSGGPPQFSARNNANQITPRDGVAPITNMYLWQPLAGGFYAPCVDGDYDMSIIGHEYTHAISNRMVAGPDSGLSGSNSRAMGESWSDLVAMEILNEYGFAPMGDENPYAVGPYATNNKQTGIRNYAMNESPLNFSNIGYDFVCNSSTCSLQTQVHADGEIWSAVNFAIREAMNRRYGSGDDELQFSCAEGRTPVEQCPGNRRWIQLVFDAWLLMADSRPSMLDARDAMLAADQVRFNGQNQDLLWTVFASRGFGEGAVMTSSEDVTPTPSFESPFANEGAVVFEPSDPKGNIIPNAQLFIGHYEARTTPVADTDPTTSLGAEVNMVPGIYDVVIQAPGYGHTRARLRIRPNRTQIFPSSSLLPNLASSARGASASGDGVNRAALIDDTEASNWASLNNAPVAGKQVTVRLDPSQATHAIRRIQVSALLRSRNPDDPEGDTGSQNRFTSLRQFELWACQARAGVDCSQNEHFQKVYTSPADAFPAAAPRPRARDMLLRSFEIPTTLASHVQLRVVSNQCTGAPAYAGDQDNDPRNVTDCAEGSAQDETVRAAELQVFNR
jgi:hypothetical protein